MTTFSGAINAGNRFSQSNILSYDGTEPVSQHLGGISGELRDVVGGSGIQQHPEKSWVDDIGAMLDELTLGKRTDRGLDESEIAGIDGVTLLSVTGDSMSVQIRGWDGTYDTLMIEGAGMAEVIDDTSGRLNIRNRDSQFGTFELDGYHDKFKAYVGGTSGELRDVIGGTLSQTWGTRRVRDENGDWVKEKFQKNRDLDQLLDELLISDARPTERTDRSDIVGIERVELASLTGDSFMLVMDGWDGTKDTAVFSGAGIARVIEEAAEDRLDVKGWHSDFVVMDYADGLKQHIGGTWGELKDVVGHNIEVNARRGIDDVEALLEELLHGNAANKPDRFGRDEVAGIDGVELLGIDQDSFSIRIDSWSNDHGEMVDTILFRDAGEVIASVMAGVDEIA